MPADDTLDQRSLQVMLAARYPGWTIWFGEATRRWWALPSRDRSAKLVEARNVEDLMESIEARAPRGRVPIADPIR
jgi:hypothetical protein